jgi:mycothiol synthase
VEHLSLVPAVHTDAAAVSAVVAGLECSLYPQLSTSFSHEDLVEEWASLDLKRHTRVVRDADRIVGYGVVRDKGELWRAEGYVHPAAHGRGIGKLLATALERDAAAGGARRIQNGVYELDAAACRLLESIGYRPVRIFREMRIELAAPPPMPTWPEGLRITAFDPERDAVAFHAAEQEAFAEHWEYTPRDFDFWSREHLTSERFDPALWCVVRAGDEIAAGTICTAATYGGGFVHILFTRHPWRRHGIGAALLADAFRRLWERGERSVGLGVDTESRAGAFRLYERAGMTPALGWAMYEKEIRAMPSASNVAPEAHTALVDSDVEGTRGDRKTVGAPGEDASADERATVADARDADADARDATAAKRAATADVRELVADARGAEADLREVVADARSVAADAREADAEARESSADARESSADARESSADARSAAADVREILADVRQADAVGQARRIEELMRTADERAMAAELRLAEANVHMQAAKEHFVAAEAQTAAADHRSEDAERLMNFADEQLVVAAAKLAEATSDSEEYQRALFDYTALVRHRMANPLQTIVGAAATLKARPDLPSAQQLALLDAIAKEAVVLERICLTPKIMHPSEDALDPTPTLQAGA